MMVIDWISLSSSGRISKFIPEECGNKRNSDGCVQFNVLLYVSSLIQQNCTIPVNVATNGVVTNNFFVSEIWVRKSCGCW